MSYDRTVSGQPTVSWSSAHPLPSCVTLITRLCATLGLHLCRRTILSRNPPHCRVANETKIASSRIMSRTVGRHVRDDMTNRRLTNRGLTLNGASKKSRGVECLGLSQDGVEWRIIGGQLRCCHTSKVRQ